MKKRIFTCLLALLAVLTMIVPAWAEQTEDDLFVYDTENLLTEDEWLELELLADEISWRYDCAVYIVTIYDYEDYDSDIHYAAVNIYDNNSFGIGENREGIMLMLSTYDRDYDLYVRDGGTAEYAVNKYGRHQMTEEFLDNFADDDWAGGFRDYLNESCRAGAPRQKAADQGAAYGAGYRYRSGSGRMPVPEGQDEVRPSGRGGGYLRDGRGAEPYGAVRQLYPHH